MEISKEQEQILLGLFITIIYPVWLLFILIEDKTWLEFKEDASINYRLFWSKLP